MKQMHETNRRPGLIKLISVFIIATSGLYPQAVNMQRAGVSIDLEKAIKNTLPLNISQFVNEIEYVPLDLTPESTLSENINVELTDDFILVANSISGSDRQLKVFDRKSGKFIYGIGSVGRGPEEYTSPCNTFYNRYDNKIYANGESGIKVYGLDGKFLESISLPLVKEPSSEDGNIHTGIQVFLDASTFVDFTDNSAGKLTDRILILDRSKVIKMFPPLVSRPADFTSERYQDFAPRPVFFSCDGNLFVKVRSNDTIFNITRDRLSPGIVLNSGNHRWPSYISRTTTVNRSDLFQIYNIYESKGYLFFEFRYKIRQNPFKPNLYLVTYNKRTGDIRAALNEKRELPVIDDDINGFLGISPLYINGRNEMIAVLEAIDILSWKNQNPSKALTMQNKFPWLRTINESDNPVIVIGKCK